MDIVIRVCMRLSNLFLHVEQFFCSKIQHYFVYHLQLILPVILEIIALSVFVYSFSTDSANNDYRLYDIVVYGLNVLLIMFRSMLSSVFLLEETVCHLAVMSILCQLVERATPDKMF